MQIVTFSYTLPTDPQKRKEIAEKAEGWSAVILSEPNATELRAYRSPDGKEALTITRVQSLAELDKFLASDTFKTLQSEMESTGCSNFKLRTWEPSPVLPEAIRREI